MNAQLTKSLDEEQIKLAMNIQEQNWNMGNIPGFMSSYWKSDSLLFIGSKGPTYGWSKTLANELGQFGITVNNVLPGATATERLSEIIKNKATKTGKTVDEVSNAMKNSVPARRFAQPEEIANAIAFLASEAASYINGINVPVDGGRTKSL